MAKADRVAITIRSTGALRDRIIASAEANGRSVSAEIEHLLEQSFDPERTLLAEAVRSARVLMDAE